MHEQIAGETFAIIGEAAPAEEADRVEGSLRSIPEESVPIDGLRAGVGRDGIDPGAAGGVAIGRSLDEEYISERAGSVRSSRAFS